MVDWVRLANSYARNAIEGNREACESIVANYAHVARKPVRDVLVAFSVSLMDSNGFEYDEYHKIREVLTWHLQKLSSTTY